MAREALLAFGFEFAKREDEGGYQQASADGEHVREGNEDTKYGPGDCVSET